MELILSFMEVVVDLMYFSCIVRTLHRCSAVKLQNCFVDYETSPDFISMGVRDDDGIFLWGELFL